MNVMYQLVLMMKEITFIRLSLITCYTYLMQAMSALTCLVKLIVNVAILSASLEETAQDALRAAS